MEIPQQLIITTKQKNPMSVLLESISIEVKVDFLELPLDLKIFKRYTMNDSSQVKMWMKSSNQKKVSMFLIIFRFKLTFFLYPIRKESPQASHQSICSWKPAKTKWAKGTSSWVYYNLFNWSTKQLSKVLLLIKCFANELSSTPSIGSLVMTSVVRISNKSRYYNC